MRKILTFVLAIMMVVTLVAALPAAAAASKNPLPTGVFGAEGEDGNGLYAGRAKFDYTTKDQSYGPADPTAYDIIVTELMIDSSISNDTTGTVDPTTDCYNYIEIYNRGEVEIDLSQLKIVGAPDGGAGDGTRNTWDTTGTFSNYPFEVNAKERGGELYISKGENIYDDRTGLTEAQSNRRYTDAPVDNPDQMKLKPGEFAIIWLFTDNCFTASQKMGKSLAAADTSGLRAPFPMFRDHYAKVAGIQQYVDPSDPESGFTDEFQRIEDTLIVAAYSNGSTSLGFSGGSRIYALTHAEQFDPTADEPVDRNNVLRPHNEFIYSYFGYSTGDRHGIVGAVENYSTIYVPSASNPELFNAFAADALPEGQTYDYAKYDDYLKIGVSQSYLEMAAMSSSEEPTIGTMKSYQWKYVDPDRMQEHVDDGDTFYIADWGKSWKDNDINTIIQADADTLRADWATKTVEDLIDKRVVELQDVEKDETLRDETYVDQDFWLNMEGSNVSAGGNKKDGLPIWALILIIAGGVLLLGGAAVVVIIILKKKKAPVAADDVALEGDVEVVDTTADEAEPTATDDNADK